MRTRVGPTGPVEVTQRRQRGILRWSYSFGVTLLGVTLCSYRDKLWNLDDFKLNSLEVNVTLVLSQFYINFYNIGLLIIR